MATLQRRLGDAGLRRTPWLTLAVFVLTAVPSGLQFAYPAVLHHLERTPAGLHGQWWRSVTALLVQDGGLLGTLSNLAFLLVIGAIAEQLVSRPRWLALYLVPGLAGELAAYAWQPAGAGNSVAICGLAGTLAVLMLRDRPGVPAPAPPAVMLWTGAVVATASTIAGIVIFAVTFPLLGLAGRRQPGRIAGAVAILGAAALAAVQNIHGAALIAGALLALALTWPGTGGRATPRHHDPA